MKNNRVYELALIVLLISSSGCYRDAAQNANETQIVADEEKTAAIVPGVGIADIRIGMPLDVIMAKEAHGTITPVPGYHDRAWLTLKNRGMEINLQNQQVHAIHVFFASKKYQDFKGVTDRGIGKHSTIKDVICSYGQPAMLMRTSETVDQSMLGAKTVDLMYIIQGISFEFVNDRLASISVFPRSDRKADLWRDIGDVEEFRKMECD